MLQQSRTDSRDSHWWFRRLESILRVIMNAKAKLSRMASAGAAHRTGRPLDVLFGELPPIDGASGQDEFSE